MRRVPLGLLIALIPAAAGYADPVAAPSEPPAAAVAQPVEGSHPPQPLFTREVLRRGQDRYAIFCTPCHGYAGDGDGMIVRRGFPPPPSYHTDRLRELPPEYVVGVISDGFGRMLPMGERIPVSDRWAIAAYVKALQLSRQFPEAEPPTTAEQSEGD